MALGLVQLPGGGSFNWFADRRDAWREEMWGHYRLSKSYWERKNILYFIRKYG